MTKATPSSGTAASPGNSAGLRCTAEMPTNPAISSSGASENANVAAIADCGSSCSASSRCCGIHFERINQRAIGARHQITTEPNAR
jgi:hypothetical protein